MKNSAKISKTSEEKTLARKPRILLAEDDAAMRRYLEVILKKLGCEVVTAEEGLAAMNIALTDSEIAAFVFDAMMPNFTGYDLCRILRQNPNHTEKTMIILSGLEIKENSHEGGANFYLVKNADLHEELKSVLLPLLQT